MQNSRAAIYCVYTVLRDDAYTALKLTVIIVDIVEGAHPSLAEPVPMASAGHFSYNDCPDVIPLAPVRLTDDVDVYDSIAEADQKDLADVITECYAIDKKLNNIIDAKERGDHRAPNYLLDLGLRLELGDV